MSWARLGPGGVFCGTVSWDAAQSALCSRASLWWEVARAYQKGCPVCCRRTRRSSQSHRRRIWLTTFAAPAGTPAARSRPACRRRWRMTSASTVWTHSGHSLPVGHRARNGRCPRAGEVGGESDAGGVLAGPAPRRIRRGLAPGLWDPVVPGGAEPPRVEVGRVPSDVGVARGSVGPYSAPRCRRGGPLGGLLAGPLPQ